MNTFFSKISGWSSKSIDEKWDRASGDSRQFGDTQFVNSQEWSNTPNEVRAIYNDLSHAIFKTRKNMNTGYAFDASYAPVYGYHSGIDLAATTNVDNVRVAVNGVVAVKPYHEKRRDGSSNGWWMAIDEVDAKGQETGRRWWYGHMAQEPKGFNLGTRVTGGETILAKAGMGHLHLAVQNVPGSITNGKTVQEVQNKSISPIHAYWKYKNGIKEARIWTL